MKCLSFCFLIAAVLNMAPPEPLKEWLDNERDLPRYEEAGYSPLGQMPLVDQVLKEPFSLPTWTDETRTALKNSAIKNRLFLVQSDVLKSVGVSLETLPSPRFYKKPAPESFHQALGKEQGQKFYSYFLSFKAAYQAVEKELSKLSDEELKWVKDNYDRFFNDEYYTTDRSEPLKFFDIASKVNLSVFSGELRVLSALVDRIFQDKTLESFSIETPFRYEEDEISFYVNPFSRVVVKEEADFVIDFGKNNHVLTRAGGTGGSRAAQMHVALDGGHLYQGENFVQGAGFLGVGLLANKKGGHTFRAKAYAQGLGFIGSGLLYNGEGFNTFIIEKGGQSLALFGTSLLWNHGGHNRLESLEGYSQAAAGTLGVAFLIDGGGSSDYFNDQKKMKGFGQGGAAGMRHSSWDDHASLYGGVACFYSMKGKNRFRTHWLGQGSAYFLGLGSMISEGSKNSFKADQVSMGQGLHLAAGIFQNFGNSNTFNGGWGSLGSSGDRALGMFFSLGNCNTFKGTVQSLGSSRKPFSLAVFVSKGENNTFEYGDLSFTELQMPDKPDEWPEALVLIQGDEKAPWGIPPHSLGMSLPYIPLSKLNKPLPKVKKRETEALDLEFYLHPENKIDFKPYMNNPETFAWAVNKIIQSEASFDIKPILEKLNSYSPYNRRMALLLIHRFWTDSAEEPVSRLIHDDPSDRIKATAARILALHVSSDGLDLVQEDLDHPNEAVRYYLAKGLKERKEERVVDMMTPLLDDPSPYVRRQAAVTLISIGEEDIALPVLIETLNTPTLDLTDNYGQNLFNELKPYLGDDIGNTKESLQKWYHNQTPCNAE